MAQRGKRRARHNCSCSDHGGVVNGTDKSISCAQPRANAYRNTTTTTTNRTLARSFRQLLIAPAGASARTMSCPWTPGFHNPRATGVLATCNGTRQRAVIEQLFRYFATETQAMLGQRLQERPEEHARQTRVRPKKGVATIAALTSCLRKTEGR